jgi:hypothetical protein
MHVVAHRLQAALIAALDQQRLVAPAEHVAKQPVPVIQADGV